MKRAKKTIFGINGFSKGAFILNFSNAAFLCFASFLFIFSFFSPSSPFITAQEKNSPSPPLRLDSTLFEPTEHPDYGRHPLLPPGWKTFDHETQFICLRGFSSARESGKLLAKDLQKSYDAFAAEGLGRVLWPFWETIYYDNLDEVADFAQKNGLYLFDFWGYVPGSGPYGSGGCWLQFRADPKQFTILEERLGDRWLGMDNGEQDGRYIGGYAPEMAPISDNRFDQYLNFQRHFERLGDDLGNRLATLVSLNFGHYFLKEGIYTLIGAETAQGLPNSQVYYSWIRGAGKEYGVLWFGNASIYNRWGFKSYPKQPTDGTSLNLLKRLMFSHILYNSAAVGFENGWFDGAELSPIGKIQKDAARWVRENGNPGVMATPVALLSDFFCGWSFPRHLYSDMTYRVWGNIPYGPGDYLNNDILDLLYPGYQDSSYFHNENGFLTPTPYGDSADSLLSDAPLWLLKRYPLLIVADELCGGSPGRNGDFIERGKPNGVDVELADKLNAYVLDGGRLVMTAGNLAALPDGLFGVSVAGPTRSFAESSEIRFEDGTALVEERPFDIVPLTLPSDARPLATCGDLPVAVEIPFGRGTVLLLTTPFGISSERAFKGKIANDVDTPLANPYPLLSHVRRVVGSELDKMVLFDVGDGLGSIVCRKGKNLFTVGVFNNGLTERPFAIRSRIGEIESIRELPIDVAERSAVGFLPKGFEDADLGRHSATAMAGADVRIFEVTLKEEKIAPLPHAAPPKRPENRYLTLRSSQSVKEEILARPTFFHHYDGVVIDWRYLESRSVAEVEKEGGWIRRQGLNVIVDFSSGINLFPDLRLIRNDPEEFERSMATFRDVMTKGAFLGVRDILLVTHRVPENNYSSEETYGDIKAALRELCAFAAEKGMTVSLRVGLNQSPRSLDEAFKLVGGVDAANLKIAPSLYKLNDPFDPAIKEKFSFVLAAGTLRDEANGTIWTASTPLDKGDVPVVGLDYLIANPELPIVFDAVYANRAEEYRDAKTIEENH